MRDQYHKSISILIRLMVVSTCLFGITAIADAANLTVEVSRQGVGGKGLQPLVGAHACYETTNGSRAESKETDSQGRAVFTNVPQADIKITASASGFAGISIQITMPATDKTETFTLITGSGGPVCDISPPPPPPVHPPDDTGTGDPRANLNVLVSRTNNTLISGASVCLRFGSVVRSGVTGVTGQVAFNDIVVGDVTITVSSPGFIGQSRTSALPPSGGTTRFILSEGSGGPVCTASAPPPSGPATLAITSFDWRVNRRTPLFFEIALNFQATATPGGPVVPTHYRVGESSDLSHTQWIAFPGGVPLFQMGYRGNSLTAYGQRTLFVQVKQGDLISAVASKAVNLQPLQTAEFRLQGLDLFAMLSFARDNGFLVRARTVSTTQNVCGAIDFSLNSQVFQGSTGSLKDRVWEAILEANLLELSSKLFTAGWRVKSIDIGRTNDAPPSVAQTITGAPDGDGFRVTIRLTAPRDPNADPGFCLQDAFPLRNIVLEGPADDLALDQTKRWKNMFPPH